ncbi:unnamed protein product [Blepharisma stoltei]|uniref:Uncharacterized protein n=1 Tax=Blepharisma stoltei TaxID=1481888 RepID=A0AAU9J0P2_9CILI|nr:unnamed protein product [Blepharisma stoltei]
MKINIFESKLNMKKEASYSQDTGSEEDVDSMIVVNPEIKNEDSPGNHSIKPFTNGYQSSPHTNQSLDDILEDVKHTLNDLPPPKYSRKEINKTWEFLKSIKKEDILSFVRIIDSLPNSAIHEKVKEIEQLALRLDLSQAQEFAAGEEMNIMQR